LWLRVVDARARALGVLPGLGVAAYLLQSGVLVGRLADEHVLVHVLLRSLAIASVFCFWALARWLFEDRFVFARWHGLLLVWMIGAGTLRVRSTIGWASRNAKSLPESRKHAPVAGIGEPDSEFRGSRPGADSCSWPAIRHEDDKVTHVQVDLRQPDTIT
jgi:hypothetical protein